MKKEGNLSRDERCEGKERWPWQAVGAPIFCSKAAAGFVANCLLLRCQALPPSPSLSFPPFTFRLCARAVLLPFLALFAEKVISVRLPLSALSFLHSMSSPKTPPRRL